MANNHPLKEEIDLGLAILGSLCPGTALNCTEISHFCGCHPSLIYAIEKRAMQKLRGRLHGLPEILDALKLRL
jgi:hypothetical protein